MEKDEKLRTRLMMMELDKTPERLEFERTYKCWVYITREENKYGYDIDSVYGGHRESEPEDFAHTVHMMKLRARLNMGQVKAIWLPKEIKADVEWIQNNKPLIEKYSFKI